MTWKETTMNTKRIADVIEYIGGWAIVMAMMTAFGFLLGASIALA